MSNILERHENILSEKKRKKLLSFVKNRILKIDGHPGLQTFPNLHLQKETQPLLKEIDKLITNYTIEKCWANYTTGNYICWHNHPDCIVSIVYFLENPENIGVMFKDFDFLEHDVISYCEGTQNSLVIFNSKLTHSVPNYWSGKDRYSIAIDLR